MISEVTPGRAPPSICVFTAQLRTVYLPTPTCLAIASAAAVNDENSRHGPGVIYSLDARMKVDGVGTARRDCDPIAEVDDRGTRIVAASSRSHIYVDALMRNGLQGSMGRVGKCDGDPTIESFVALLRRTVLGRNR